MLAEDPEVPTARAIPSVWWWRCAFLMPIPLSLVGFADALDPWASYRNHPVVRTPGGWHASGRRRPLGRIARGGLGRGGVNAAAMSFCGRPRGCGPVRRWSVRPVRQ